MNEYTIPVEWKETYVKILDQTALPERETYLEIRDAAGMWDAIKRLCVRGAPAIGIAAAYGVCIEMRHHVEKTVREYHEALNRTIEERDPEEVANGFGRRTAPKGVKIYNPAFDVTPHELITAIVTERGIVKQPDARKIAEMLGHRDNR